MSSYCCPTLWRQVPKCGPAPPRSDVTAVISDTQVGKKQQAYKTEIIGGVVVQTPIQVIKWELWCCESVWKCIGLFIVTEAYHSTSPSASETTLRVVRYMCECGGDDCFGDNGDGCDEMFQNESEEAEGRERKGSRPGVLRCSYCVKQGNVVSTQRLLTD